MNAIRTIQHVTGPTLTIAVPADLAGKQVEVIVLPVDNTEPLPPELDPRYARFIMPKPPLTEAQKKELEQNPFPLRGTGSELIDPYEPAVPAEDWEVYRDDPA
jgi:hypothetical protein